MSYAFHEIGLRRKARREMYLALSTIRTLDRFRCAAIASVPKFPALSTISKGSEPSESSVGAEASSDEYESADSS